MVYAMSVRSPYFYDVVKSRIFNIEFNFYQKIFLNPNTQSQRHPNTPKKNHQILQKLVLEFDLD